MRQERFILRDFIRLMTCFVENVKEGEILEGFRIDLPAVVEQILPLLLRDRPPMPDWLRSTPLSRLLMVDARVDRAPEHIPGGPAELLLRDGRGWDLTAPRAELRTM